MNEGVIVDRYARAILEIGVENGELESLRQGLEAFAETYRNSPELRAVLGNPGVEEAERRAVVVDVARALGLATLVERAIVLLAERQRLGLLSAIARRVASLADTAGGVVRATVTSAVPLREDYRQRLAAELETATGRTVVLECREDPELIAGIVTRVGDLVIDGSVRGRLEGVERRLLHG
jgi:F-type H+-transporting ATPase subunit delta